MSDFVICEDEFRRGILEKAPVPEYDQCIILYRKKVNQDRQEWQENSLLIERGMICSSGELRHGGYNQKVILSYRTEKIEFTQSLFMKEHNYKFDIKIELEYRIKDAKKYFFEGRTDKNDIQHVLKKAVTRYDGYWSITQMMEIERELEKEIEDRMESFKGLSFNVIDVEVIPDEAVKKMQENTKSAAVDMLVARNEADKKINENNLSGEILESDFILKKRKMMFMNTTIQNYGNMGPIVNDYLDGKISGEDLYKYNMTHMTNEMQMVESAYGKDLISQEMADRKMKAILENDSYRQMEAEEQSVQNEKNIQRKKIDTVNDTEVKDGDYL